MEQNKFKKFYKKDFIKQRILWQTKTLKELDIGALFMQLKAKGKKMGTTNFKPEKEFKYIDFDEWRRKLISDDVKNELEKRGEENCYREKHLKKLYTDLTNFYKKEIENIYAEK